MQESGPNRPLSFVASNDDVSAIQISDARGDCGAVIGSGGVTSCAASVFRNDSQCGRRSWTGKYNLGVPEPTW